MKLAYLTTVQTQQRCEVQWLFSNPFLQRSEVHTRAYRCLGSSASNCGERKSTRIASTRRHTFSSLESVPPPLYYTSDSCKVVRPIISQLILEHPLPFNSHHLSASPTVTAPRCNKPPHLPSPPLTYPAQRTRMVLNAMLRSLRGSNLEIFKVCTYLHSHPPPPYRVPVLVLTQP